jgi:hypothetical protein
VAVCAALAFGACGEEAERDLESLSPAANAIEAAGAVAFRSTSTTSGFGAQATIEGVVDAGAEKARLSMTMDGIDDNAMKMEQLIVGRDLYMRTQLDGPAAASLGQRHMMWQHERLPSPAGGAAFIGSYSPINVATDLRKAEEVRRAGRESIRGEMTTRYTGELDLEHFATVAAIDDVPRQTLDEVEAALLEVWIDDRGLPRRQVTTLRLGTVETRTQTDFLRYGVNADFQPPPRAEIG